MSESNVSRDLVRENKKRRKSKEKSTRRMFLLESANLGNEISQRIWKSIKKIREEI